jgi:1-deoxy-D-xylulose-5-phosphate reductoisomerase
VLHAADQWAVSPATVDEVLDAQRWARERARRSVAHARPAEVSAKASGMV